jgi:hypothetical protein
MTLSPLVLVVTILSVAGSARDVCKGADGAVLRVEGEVIDDTVTWQIDDDLLFSGTLDETGEVITGTFLFDGGNGSDSFTARKK